MKKYFHIFLIFILVLVFVLNSFVNAFAIAIVDDSILLGIIGTVLIGCGIVGFNDVDTLKTTAQSFWTSIPDDVKDFFNNLVDLATGHGLGSFTFELTTEVVNAIQNWLSGVKAEDGVSVSVGNGVFIDGVDYSYLPLIDYEAFVADSSNCGLISLSSLAEYGTFYPANNGVSAHYIVNLPFFNVVSNSSVSAVYIYTNKDKPKDDGQFINILQDGSIDDYTGHF